MLDNVQVINGVGGQNDSQKSSNPLSSQHRSWLVAVEMMFRPKGLLSQSSEVSIVMVFAEMMEVFLASYNLQIKFSANLTN